MSKKIQVQLKVVKILSYVMLILLNVIMEPSNVREKKIGELLNVTKVQSHVMLTLPNVMM